MASNLDFFVAFLLGILPGIGILWVSLRRFDRPHVDHTLFDDRRVFGGLAAGLVFGTVASVLTFSLSGYVSLWVFVAAVVLEESFKLVYLNPRSSHGSFDTTSFGIPLGRGVAQSGV